MSILEVTATAFGPGREGGGERHPLGFATELSRHEPVVFACSGALPTGTGPVERLAVPATGWVARPFLTPTNPMPSLRTAQVIGRYLREHAGEVEFVHIHNLRTAMGTLWVLLSHLRRRGDRFHVILTDHGARFFPWPGLTARLVDYFAPVSRYSESILLSWARRPSRVIPACVSDAFVGPDPVPNWSARDLDLLFTGRVVSWKRPERLLTLARDLAPELGRPVRGAIAGAVADPELWAQLRRQAEALAPRVTIEFAPNPSDQEMLVLYRRSRLFVFASDRIDARGRRHPAPELSSATVLEAAAGGAPAVAGRFPAALENIREGESGLFVGAWEGQPTARTVSAVLDDPAAWQRLSAGARAYVLAERTYPRAVARFREFLQDIRRGAV